MLNDYIATLRPSSTRYHLRPQRLCSCCREPGHTILHCDDPRIDSLYNESRRIFGQYTDNYYTPYLDHVDFNVIKALCLRLGMSRTASFVSSRSKGSTLLITYFTRIRAQESESVFVPFTNERADENVKLIINIEISPNDFIDIDCSCPSCYTTELDNMIKYDCNHFMCGDCFVGTVKAMPKLKYPTCALCRNPVKKFTINKEDTYSKITKAFMLSPF